MWSGSAGKMGMGAMERAGEHTEPQCTYLVAQESMMHGRSHLERTQIALGFDVLVETQHAECTNQIISGWSKAYAYDAPQFGVDRL
jgi:hypothetical protein